MGVAGKYPRLASNPVVIAEEPASLIRLLAEGGSIPTIEGPQKRDMPSFAGKLTDAEMAHVLTFVRNARGNAAGPVTTREVRAERDAIHK